MTPNSSEDLASEPPAEPNPQPVSPQDDAPFADGPLPSGMPAYKTKMDALGFGLKLGACAWLLSIILLLLALTVHGMKPRGLSGYANEDAIFHLDYLFRAAWIFLGISAFVSAWSGFETHRLATGDRRFVIIPWWQWLVPMICCMGGLPFWICLMLQFYRREQLFLMKKPVENWGVMVYSILGLVTAVISISNASYPEVWITYLGITNLLFLFATDCVMVNQVTKWGNATALAPRYAKFQFTLGHMLKAILLGGLYLTVLLKLFHVI